MRKLLAILPAAVALAAPGVASAAQRYADPAGSGPACSQAIPCTLDTAIAGGNSGDEVVVNPGSYSVSTAIVAPTNMNIHGIVGQPMPQITSTVAAGQAAIYYDNGDAISNLQFTQAVDNANAIAPGSLSPTLSIDHVVINVAANAVGASLNGNTTVSDTLVNITVDGGTGLFVGAGSNTLENVTVVGEGAIATGVSVFSPATLGISNSILEVDGGGTEIFNNLATVTVDHSNYRPGATSGAITDNGGNQDVLPQFVNRAAGNLRELATSPTVDAGDTNGLTPSTDLDYKPRPIGPANDMGAYEYGAAPTVTTGSASSGQPTTATVSGQINTNDSDSTYHFDYGTTTAYGSATGVASLGASLAGATALSSSLQGLQPNTTYHYRLVSSNALGTTVGADATFKTPAVPYAGLIVPKQTVRISPKRRTGILRVRCPASTVDGCNGRVSISVSAKRGKRRIKLSLSTRVNVAANDSAKAPLRLSKRQFRILHSLHRMAGVATANTTDGADQSKQTTGRVSLKG